MNILIAHKAVIPAFLYGGIERVIWYLGKELIRAGHSVTYLVNEGSNCDFAPVLFFDHSKSLSDQIPDSIDMIHFQYYPEEEIKKPYLITSHTNIKASIGLDRNTVFVSKYHASRYGSDTFVYNGVDWSDYGNPNLEGKRKYFHFLGKAAWRVKNVQGAINTIKLTSHEKMKVLGGNRLNIKMGFRLTLSPRIGFCGMVGGEEKNELLRHSKGLVFPVRWHEPFGIAITESLYFGCTVFGTPYGSLPELVNKDVGYLSSNSSELAEAIEGSDSYSKKRCHEYAREEFNSKKMAEAYVRNYERVLNGDTLNANPPKLLQKQMEKFLPWTK
ncbi:glycosyltransferase family 4 protein [Flammeovirgaceae bacterium]